MESLFPVNLGLVVSILVSSHCSYDLQFNSRSNLAFPDYFISLSHRINIHLSQDRQKYSECSWYLYICITSSNRVLLANTCITHSKEFSKALRALKTLTSEPDDSRDEEHAQRLREMTGRLKQLCNKDVGDGEVPNPHKLLQIHLKHTVLYSEKIRGTYALLAHTFWSHILR